MIQKLKEVTLKEIRHGVVNRQQPAGTKEEDVKPTDEDEYPDADEDPDEDRSLMPYADSRHAVRFKTCGANRDAQEKEGKPERQEKTKTKMRRKLLSFVCIV